MSKTSEFYQDIKQKELEFSEREKDFFDKRYFLENPNYPRYNNHDRTPVWELDHE